MNDPWQVIDVIRDVLLEHMNSENAVPQFRVQSAVFIDDQTGRVVGPDELALSVGPGGELVVP